MHSQTDPALPRYRPHNRGGTLKSSEGLFESCEKSPFSIAHSDEGIEGYFWGYITANQQGLTLP